MNEIRESHYSDMILIFQNTSTSYNIMLHSGYQFFYMPLQLSCCDNCKILTGLDQYNQNKSKQKIHNISIMSS